MKTSRIAFLLIGGLPLACALVYGLQGNFVGKGAFLGERTTSPSWTIGNAMGSAQDIRRFASTQYFWGRPAAAGSYSLSMDINSARDPQRIPHAYSDTVKGRVAALLAADPGNKAPIPPDLFTASGAILDPEISLASARYQVHRIAATRRMSPQHIETLIAQFAGKPPVGARGEARVNVIALNQALDRHARETR